MTFVIALILISADVPNDAPNDAAAKTIEVRESSRAEKLAPLASLLFPGTGELIRGYKLKGELFLWGDAAAMTVAAAYGWDGINKRGASVSLAVMYADASISNSSRAYFNAMENYGSSQAYNQSVAREARSLYPDDLAAQQEYLAENSYAGEDAWEWQSDSLWDAYLDQRTGMRKANQVSTAFLGIMLLTRLSSLLDVSFFSPVGETRLGVVPVADPAAPGLELVYRF